uniref:O-methyltransferase dimerisation domain-containing protein n=1 Tax=Aegilops tauschii subsp. strangulata TaxID=200361 RepID=A0A452ZJR9_AEGTS
MALTVKSTDDHALLNAEHELWATTFSYIKSMALKSALDLRLADAIHHHGGAATLPQIAARVTVHPSKIPCLRRLMRTLTVSGVFSVVQQQDVVRALVRPHAGVPPPRRLAEPGLDHHHAPQPQLRHLIPGDRRVVRALAAGPVPLHAGARRGPVDDGRPRRHLRRAHQRRDGLRQQLHHGHRHQGVRRGLPGDRLPDGRRGRPRRRGPGHLRGVPKSGMHRDGPRPRRRQGSGWHRRELRRRRHVRERSAGRRCLSQVGTT